MKSTVIAGAVTATLVSTASALAEQNRVRFPGNLGELEHYTTVRRGEVTEFMYTSREAADAAKAGEPIPPGTQVILQDWRNGEVYRLFVMEKGENWGDDYEEAMRTENWQFQWFWPDGSINLNENTQRCRSCHQARDGREFMYTFDQLRNYE
ncbi:cytochrome P460 family protein [Roseibium aggregatum]|uniref:Cytochrome P460 family protein n=1 Tax=Roseibium aggregatum TaxID=187304 RepID=A0A939J3V8_9HYPH|nr:cytochrome P460 family protein [Roseibium aggregatum]MBN9670545.1 cytochrome P460 family protein [Roseibium aggregatum]